MGSIMRKIVSCFVVCAFVGLLALAFIPEPVSAMTGNGTVGDPYMIYNITDLQDMQNDLTAYYELANDIDASGTATWNWNAGRGVYEGFVPISSFSGNFSGNYYTISDLYMDWENAYCCAGLFGQLGDNAVIENVVITGADITNHYTHASLSGTAGVLVGTIYRADDITIRRVVVEGDVHNYFTSSAVPAVRGCAGGMVGYIWSGSGIVIEECAAYVDVVQNCYSEAYSYAGGFVGFYDNGGSPDLWIRNCYARGDASAYGPNWRDAGGFCGWQDDTNNRIDDCYSTGIPIGWAGGFVGKGDECSVVTNCFWDTESSGIGTSDCGTGKTTAEMTTESTFTSVGWDFTNIWAIIPTFNDGYPHFLWYSPFPWEDYEAYQVLWYQPEDIIHGTTLPDRTTPQEHGIITWGANPPGISIIMGPLTPDDPMPEYVLPDDIVEPPLDMVGPTGHPRWTKDLSSLETHPFYPAVSMVSVQTSIPVELVWTIGALLILLVAMLVSYRYAPHQIITALIGGGLAAFFYQMCIFPFWVIFIFVLMAVAIIVGERSPTVS